MRVSDGDVGAYGDGGERRARRSPQICPDEPERREVFVNWLGDKLGEKLRSRLVLPADTEAVAAVGSEDTGYSGFGGMGRGPGTPATWYLCPPWPATIERD